MRKPIALTGLTALALVGGAPTALADAPTEFVVERTFADVNACTGEDHEVTLTFTVREHTHHDDVVATVKGEARTSDGYVGKGTETTLVRDGRWLTSQAKWMNVNPDTGGRYQVRHDSRIDLETGEAHLDRLVVRCVRQP